MDNICFSIKDFRVDGILADRIVLGNFVKGNCKIPTIYFIDSSEYIFFVYVKSIEYERLYKKCMDLQNEYGFNLEKIRLNSDKEDYRDFRLRPILCSSNKEEFYTLDVDYLDIQNIDSLC